MTTGVELATAYVSLSVETRDIGRDVTRMFSGVDSQAQQTGRRAGDKMGGAVLGAAKTFAAPIAAALGTGILIDFTKEAVNLGSALEQSLGGAQAVFKDDFDQINEIAKDAATNLGLSKNDYLELSTVLGAGIKNKGIKDFADQTENLIGLGADLAAQYGGSTADAVDAISSAMRGESDPIERYGVSLNETAVNAELAANGQDKLKGKALEAAKAQARIGLLFEQSQDALGAYGREADTLAGVNGRLGATWEDMKADIGTALLPAARELSSWFLQDGLPAVKEFGGWIRDDLWPALQEGYQTVMPGLEKALDILSGGVGDGTFSWEEFGAVLTDKVIPFAADLTNIYLPAWAAQIRTLIEVVKAAWAVFETWRDITLGAAGLILDAFAGVTETGADMLRALSNVPGFGWAAEAADELYAAAAQASGLADAIRDIPNSKSIDVYVNTRQTGRVDVGGQSVNLGIAGDIRARARGGPVKAGTPYVVGEYKPELFVPATDGRMLPDVPDYTGSRDGIDYYRLADTLVGALRRSGSFQVEARQVAHAVAIENNRYQGM
ncbi:hypothetical protein KC207_14220 [Phycicoccus sp. BSK3Z-2]|uniref:Phage tail tape measure protein n=1 Tax=Phycicoccus avicenniae TaxID=2828860 RepID=A0A941DDQ7_9MICO|nr:hypothetical protein [Phycicoccus avicenniae]MBR7744447.1 hypothetical protein [Phycicoccus avicenniae]